MRRRKQGRVHSRGRIFLCAGALALMLASSSIHASSPVADAAMKGDAATVRTLVRQGADVNEAQADGMTALHWAALNGDLKTIEVLLVAGAMMEPLTRVGGYTPLHLASSRGHAPVVARLLEAGCKPLILTATGVQAIHLAAQAGSADAIRVLIDRGADVNTRDNTHGRTPLVFAASQNRLEAMRMLIEKGANSRLETTVIDYGQRSAADNAARSARDKVITATTGKAPTAPPQFDPPQTGRGATVGGQAAPDPAAAAGRGRGAAGNPNGPRALSDIQQIGRQGGLTALHYVAREGFVDAAMMLLDSGLDVNLPTAGDRSTPLLVAIINGHYDLAMAFIKRGANPNITSDDGAGPLFVALNNEWALRTWYPQPTAATQQRASHIDLMEALLQAGADPNARTVSHIWYAAYNAGRMGVDYTGATPLWRAAYSLDVAAMRLLV
ncbi:MAG: ankyrin repeat domain-containing protein, partial [Vicinamibacterales bacterium]